MNRNGTSRPRGGAPLRVAHVVATSGATGVESHLIALLAAFDRTLVEPTLFAPRPGPLVERLQRRGIPVELGAPTRKLAFGEARRLARRWRGAFDLVHAHGARGSFWGAVAAGQAGLPLVTTIHELRWRTLASGPRRWLWLELERRALEHSRRLIAVSEAVRRELVARRPEWASRTVVIPGTSPQLLEPRPPAPLDAPVAAVPLRLVTVGRLEPVKGHDRLLEALSRLAARIPFTLDVVGRGPLEGELRGLAARLGIADRVRWHLGADDVAEHLDRAQIFVTATREETLGLAVLEAMAAGRPVVVPAVGGLVELVGEAGCLVDPGAALPERLADVIAALAADPARMARLGAAGRARVLAAYDPLVLASRVADVYEQIGRDEGVGEEARGQERQHRS